MTSSGSIFVIPSEARNPLFAFTFRHLSANSHTA